MRVLKRCLLLPLFCFCFITSSCNSSYKQIKEEMESSLVGYQYDEVIVEEVNKVIIIYVTDHNSKASGGTSYSVAIYVYDNGSFVYIGGYTK